jgi:hypothetical protein
MKTIGIMQPYFFPYIGYWQLIHAVDRFVILDDVNYVVRGWVNRNRLLINRAPSYITVPLQQASQNKHICDTMIVSSRTWRDKLTKTVEYTYRNTPHFDEVFPVVEHLIRYPAENLADYLAYQLQTLSRLLGISTDFVVTSRIYGNNEIAGQERVLDICRREGATTYINAQGGQKLYGTDAFSSAGIDLRFIFMRPLTYKQYGTGFTPNLSIIDVMMFNSKREILADFLGNFDLRSNCCAALSHPGSHISSMPPDVKRCP